MSRGATDLDAPAPTRTHRHGLIDAALWALAGAVSTGGSWALALVAAYSLFGVTVFPNDLAPQAIDFALFGAGLGAVYGFVVSAVVALFRLRDAWHAGVFVVASVLFGAFGGGASVLAVATTDAHVHPLVSSSLAWAVVGALAGSAGYGCSRWLAKSETPEEDEEDSVPPKRIEWLLREAKRRLLTRSLLRVLPVLVASVAALIGAALVAPSDVWLALLAVGVLGLSVALVLYRQEQRIHALERRLPGGHE